MGLGLQTLIGNNKLFATIFHALMLHTSIEIQRLDCWHRNRYTLSAYKLSSLSWQSFFATLLLVLIHLLATELHAKDDYHVIQITDEEGLPHSIVYSLLVDSRGFLWAGTRDGLTRYDGYQFKTYWDGIKPLQVLTEDRHGNIWAGTPEGLYQFDRKTGLFNTYNSNISNPSTLSNHNVRSLITDKKGRIWVGTANGLNRYDEQQNSFHRYFVSTDVGVQNNIVALLEDPFNCLWVLVREAQPDHNDTVRLFYRRPQNERFTEIVLPSKLAAHYKHASRLFIDPYGTLCLVSTIAPPAYSPSIASLLVRVDLHTCEVLETITTSSEISLNERLFSKEQRSNIGWKSKLKSIPERGLPVTGDKGLYIVDLTYRSTHQQPSFTMIYPPIMPLWAQGLRRDQGGLFWTSSDDGLYKFIPTSFFFPAPLHIPTPSYGHHSLSRIRAIFRDKNGDLWVGTDTQLLQYHARSKGVTDHTASIGKLNQLQDRTINVIYEDPPYLLFGTNNGLHQYNPATGTFTRPYNSVATMRVRSIARDQNGNLWIGSFHGLSMYGPAGEQLSDTILGPASKYLQGAIWKLHSDSKGRMWAGSEIGLYRWDSTLSDHVFYEHSDADPHSLPSGSVWDVIEDHNGTIWVGVYGGGIARYRPETDDFITISTESGLPSKGVCAMLEDNRNNIWISTSAGLACYTPETNRILTYTNADGLAGNEFALKAAWRDLDGTLYFGGINQITQFNPESLRKNPHIPPIVITSFQANDSLISLELLDGDTVQLEYWQNHISVEFAALDFLNPEGNLYQYKMETIEKDWTYAGTQRYARYAGLDPGHYILAVKGANSHGTWNNKGIRIHIIITPPYWATFWFRFAAIGAILVCGFFWYRQWLRRNREREERHIVEAKLQALRLQMKPHFLFNSLNSIHSFIVQHKADEAGEYLTKFASLMRIALYHSQHSLISLHDELKFLSLYLELEALRYNHAFQYSIAIEPGTQTDATYLPSMLVQPYVENAIHHGLRNKPDGELEIRFRRQPEDILVCTIEDNGIGRKAAAKRQSRPLHQSMGTTVTQQRLELLNTIHERKFQVEVVDLYSPEQTPSGTRVMLRIPINKNIL